jgi:hypothetical protein
VQPLQYLPTDDGVELRFLRKKTDMKSGIDGGIQFFIQVVDKENDENDDTNSTTIEVIAKRNSKGQSIPKMFAEKLVIQAFVNGMTMGDSEESSSTASSVSTSAVVPKTRFDSPTKGMVTVESVFHKWM